MPVCWRTRSMVSCPITQRGVYSKSRASQVRDLHGWSLQFGCRKCGFTARPGKGSRVWKPSDSAKIVHSLDAADARCRDHHVVVPDAAFGPLGDVVLRPERVQVEPGGAPVPKVERHEGGVVG